jgi:hypothetical protein
VKARQPAKPPRFAAQVGLVLTHKLLSVFFLLKKKQPALDARSGDSGLLAQSESKVITACKLDHHSGD